MDFLPAALDAFRLPDTLLGDAYEATPPEYRGWIKTTLALVEATYPALPSCSEQRTESAAAGYGHVVRHSVAPWVALVIGPAYTSAVRLSAAIMSARLAGVEPLVAIWTGAVDAIPPAVLAALELTGVEQSFALPDARPVLTELQRMGAGAGAGGGRILGFGTATTGHATTGHAGHTGHAVAEEALSLRALARGLRVALWEDVSCPHFGVCCANGLSRERAAEELDLDVLQWAHPDARLSFVTPARFTVPAGSAQEAWCDALYAPVSAAFPHDCAPLRLCPGLEGAWVCPDLPPFFFRNAAMNVYGL